MELSKHFERIFLETKDPFPDILGQERVKKQLKSALISGRNIIIVGAPGIGKTTLAKSIAKLLPEITVNNCGFNCLPENPVCPICKSRKGVKRIKKSGIQRFVRIQGSPDLTVEDLIGDIDPVKALKFGPLSIEAFTPGKIFRANNGVLFFDEVNRCPEKLQNALLQVLEEKKATIGSYDVDLEANFIFIATMNPQDTSTEKLSDVFIDRFDLIYMGYPESLEIEKKIVSEKAKRVAEISFPKKLFDMMISFVRLLRESDKLEKKPSVRASIGLYERALANALLEKRKSVVFEDIKEAISSVLSHRIALKPSIKYLQTPQEFVKEEFASFSQNFKDLKSKGGDL
ncbi:MoxR family ATPase [Candidatus Woesearchaeota archaeon]|nr:MAG: MoxR family ATPase [Candidatus Woesearchaeota archaeon]